MSQFALYLFVSVFILCNITSYGAKISACAPAELAGKTLASWNALYGSNPSANIEISRDTIVDVAVVNAKGITVRAGARLYFNWNMDFTFTANFILVNGEFHIGSARCPFENRAVITLNGPSTQSVANYGRRFFVVAGGTIEMHGSKGLGTSWTKLGAHALKSANQITVIGNITTWEAGDSMVIATTDYSPLQSEKVTITAVDYYRRVITFQPNLKWNHFGAITMGVDERAEVALLTRNIKIQGITDTSNPMLGGHFAMMGVFTAAHIEGVEFFNMGQGDELGRYPLHFHISGNVPLNTYVKFNSVHQSNFRCYVVHGSSGVLLEGNVAYDNLGHCFYLEDGVEQNNRFIRNLAILTKAKDNGVRVGSELTGNGVSSFWITNVNNDFVGNVAAGSHMGGFWVEVRFGARGLCACLPQFQNLPYQPCSQPFKSFVGNTAHSMSMGLSIESTNWDYGDMPGPSCAVAPLTNYHPVLSDGTTATTYITNFTSYKTSDRALWLRNPKIIVKGARIADHCIGVELATTGEHPLGTTLQVIEDSILVGVSENKGNQDPSIQFQFWDTHDLRSLPYKGDPISGWRVYDGGQIVRRTVFRNYPARINSNQRIMSAIGGREAFFGQVATTNMIQSSTFVNVDKKFFVIDNKMDGGKTCNFKDDGSVTGFKGTVLRDYDYFRTPACRRDPSYMLVCPHKYAQLWVMDLTANGANNKLYLTRNQHTGPEHFKYTLDMEGFASAGIWRYQPIVSIGASYLLYFQNRISPRMVFQLNNADLGDAVGIYMCYPAGTTIVNVFRGYAAYPGSYLPQLTAQAQFAPITAATSLTDTGFVAGQKYYFDRSRSILAITIKQRHTRTDPGNFCPLTGCDYVWVEVAYPNGVAVNCTASAYSGANPIQSHTSWLDTPLTV